MVCPFSHADKRARWRWKSFWLLGLPKLLFYHKIFVTKCFNRTLTLPLTWSLTLGKKFPHTIVGTNCTSVYVFSIYTFTLHIIRLQCISLLHFLTEIFIDIRYLNYEGWTTLTTRQLKEKYDTAATSVLMHLCGKKIKHNNSMQRRDKNISKYILHSVSRKYHSLVWIEQDKVDLVKVVSARQEEYVNEH